MIEHQSMEFREVLNLKTEFWWYKCWDVKKAKGWAPGILHSKHILYFQEPIVELSTQAFVQLRHQLPQSQWNPQFTQKSSIWVQVKGEGITLIFFSFLCGLSTSCHFDCPLACLFNISIVFLIKGVSSHLWSCSRLIQVFTESKAWLSYPLF